VSLIGQILFQQNGSFSNAEEVKEDSKGAPSQDLVPLQGSLVNVEAIPRFTAGANQRYKDVINLTALPSALAVSVMEKAPFLLSYQDGEYGIEFD
jgi:hypothetical protein